MKNLSQNSYNYLEETAIQAQIQEELLKKISSHLWMCIALVGLFASALTMGIIFSQYFWILAYPFVALLIAFIWRQVDEQILVLRKAFYEKPLPEEAEFEGGKEIVWICTFFGKLLGEVRKRFLIVTAFILATQLASIFVFFKIAVLSAIPFFWILLALLCIPVTLSLLYARKEFAFIQLPTPLQLTAG